ncbi:hypothetical protein JQX08_00965 [Pseudomonas sp. UL073]|uniref:Strictosidine synthase conserved region domain-containing protein n=1 Tax=Zestomonas insulae TaxID=2809017 RepID=A0ABS2I7Y9_9GAMM|nr:hypothetical protein [Pseudomonas insulae]MBM7059266.1 hypothetical protein [Pseudomonas insulae]
MPLTLQPTHRRRWLWLLAALLVGGLAVPAWRHLFPVTAAAGWDYRVYQQGISRVSALALDGKGGLYVSQEALDGRGTILLLAADGQRREVLGGLSKPDGQAMFRGGLVTGQEEGPGPVLWLHDGQRSVLFQADSVEGIAADGRYVYAIEDKTSGGRLLRYDADSGTLEVLRSGLIEGEGVSLCDDGRLFYVEKAKGWVKQWQANGVDRLVVDGLNQPGFVQCTADGLWITEDATHMARLLLVDPTGRLQVILRHLRSAQTIIPVDSSRYLVAEQGRDRILEINRQSMDP